MKTLFVLTALLLSAASAHAGCGYVYVDGKAVYVCDNRSTGQTSRCGYVYVDGKAVYVCS